MSMQFRRLGKSGLEVSVICLGTMMFGDRTDAATAQKIVHSALDAGVNFIDTADVYANGASETIIAPAIAANRQRWILATKVGNVMSDKRQDGGPTTSTSTTCTRTTRTRRSRKRSRQSAI